MRLEELLPLSMRRAAINEATTDISVTPDGMRVRYFDGASSCVPLDGDVESVSEALRANMHVLYREDFANGSSRIVGRVYGQFLEGARVSLLRMPGSVYYTRVAIRKAADLDPLPLM